MTLLRGDRRREVRHGGDADGVVGLFLHKVPPDIGLVPMFAIELMLEARYNTYIQRTNALSWDWSLASRLAGRCGWSEHLLVVPAWRRLYFSRLGCWLVACFWLCSCLLSIDRNSEIVGVQFLV